MGEFFPTQIPPYVHEPRCSAKCEWNSGRTVPISSSAWMSAFFDADPWLKTLRGNSAASEAAAPAPANWRRVKLVFIAVGSQSYHGWRGTMAGAVIRGPYAA